jgi:hypothetical protein
MYVDPDFDWVDIVGRLRPGVSVIQAQAASAARYSEWQRSVAPTRHRAEVASLILRDGRQGLDSLRRSYSMPLFIMRPFSMA